MNGSRTTFRTMAPSLWVGLAVALAVLVCGEWWRPSDPPLAESAWPSEAVWIRTGDPLQTTGCFRHDFTLNGTIDHAWVRIAAQGGFELTVNGDPVGAWTYWRPSRPFQNGLTAPGQRLSTSEPAMALNFPREFQWEGHTNYRTPVFFDIRPYLRPGKNTICIETEARKPSPAVILCGEIHLAGGSTIALATNPVWLAEPVPVGCTQDEWVRPEIRVKGWRSAKAWNRGPRSGGGIVPRGTFETPFTGKWVGLAPIGNGQAGFETLVLKWTQQGAPDDAVLRIATAAPYALFLNGKPVRPDSRANSPLDDGGWLVSWEGRRPLATMPNLLDPDETGSPFAGYRFENPRHGDPTDNDFESYENTLNRTRERPTSTQQGEQLDEKFEDAAGKGRSPDPYGIDEQITLTPPLEVSRIRNREGFTAYAITGLIRPGENVLTLRLVPETDAGYRRSRARRIAAELRIGGDAPRILATGSREWRVESGEGDAMTTSFDSAADSTQLPPLTFVGHAWPGRPWKPLALAIGIVSAAGAWLMRRRIPGSIVIRCAWFAMALLAAYAMRASFLERSEALWFRDPNWAWWALLWALIVALLAPPCLRLISGLRTHGSSKRWLALILLLALCFVVRAWRIEAQPIDDDEFASIQGVVSIVETGVPEIGKDIYYTRSPLYHYAAAAVAWVAGTNLWTLRLFTVFTALATGMVLWWLARVCFRNHWIAFGALALFSLHPFIIFTSHIARFYQQQQLLVVLTALCLIRGFVQTGGPRWMVATMFVFGASMLSQEISVSLAPGLLVTYLLFGRDLPWRWELKTGLAGIIVAVLFVINVLVFQMKCLTWTAGVSPNVEATIAPNFWELGNLTSMFIGYSRLHLLASAFLPFSILAAVRRGDRSVLALHSFLYLGILSINLLVTSVSFRYQYAIIPLWLLLCVHGVAEASRLAAITLRSAGAPRRTGPAIAALAGLAILLSWSPWRIPGSYSENLLGDPITALRQVHANRREGDKVMITEPHPHAAKMELGKADYDLALPILYDFAYWDDGILRDRNGDARVVNRLAQLQDIFAREERVWIVINREKLRSRTRNLRWEYPGAREELFLRRNCQLTFRSYLWHVYLWDRNTNRYRAFRNEPNQWTE